MSYIIIRITVGDIPSVYISSISGNVLVLNTALAIYFQSIVYYLNPFLAVLQFINCQVLHSEGTGTMEQMFWANCLNENFFILSDHFTKCEWTTWFKDVSVQHKNCQSNGGWAENTHDLMCISEFCWTYHRDQSGV